MADRITSLTFGGQEVLVAVVSSSGTEKTSASSRVADAATDVLERAEEVVKSVASTGARVARSLAATQVYPRGFEIELGIAFSANGNIVIAGGGVEAGVVFRLQYDLGHGDQSESTPDGAP